MIVTCAKEDCFHQTVSHREPELMYGWAHFVEVSPRTGLKPVDRYICPGCFNVLFEVKEEKEDES